jgi:hypothetical protein
MSGPGSVSAVGPPPTASSLEFVLVLAEANCFIVELTAEARLERRELAMALANRAAALGGIAGVVLVLAFVRLTEPPGSPEDPSSALARALVDNRDSRRIGAYIGLAAVFF